MSDKASSPASQDQPFNQAAQRQYIENRVAAKTAHTPGPWTVAPRTAERPSRATVTARNGQADIYDAPLTQETAYNAALISAAPDLLATLASVRAALNCHYDSAVIEAVYGAMIDAAIAKAGGQVLGPISFDEDLERR